ncbi:MAG TPA: VWA domain-containing protein, partial [Pyrinomonadaceae bacterium]
MISRGQLAAFCALMLATLIATASQAQDKTPAPSKKEPAPSSETQDSLKVFIEEVRIPITAYDESGRFDPTVNLDDLMVREDGVLQQLKSIYRIPASVLLLLDTGGELNLAKDVSLTREVALGLAGALRADDQVAVMQVNNRVELVQPWTRDQAAVRQSLQSKLLSGKRSALTQGLHAAAEQLKKIPSGNRHLVLVSDGLDSRGVQAEFDAAIKSLIAANITVHVISYTSLGLAAKKPKSSRPRRESIVPKDVILATPRTRIPWETEPDLREISEKSGGVIIDIERWLGRGVDIREALKQREKEFGNLAEETGGSLQLPATADEMVRQVREVAREIDSQYVITYKPQRPLNSASASEYRKIDVIPRRVGLKVRA